MTALTCFEAAARHASFKVAAQELNVTPAAISHQVKALEAELGALFVRLHRGVELTETGAFLFVALQRGFEGISDAVAHIRGSADQVDVTIRATTAVSALWLTPKLTAFWRAYPAITVSQIVSDIPEAAGGHDLIVGYATAQDDDHEWRELYRDNVLALGTPAFARRHDIRGLEDLAKAPLIHLSYHGNWTGWAEWFAEFGIQLPRAPGLFLNNHNIALQLAQDDAGAVLGWQGLAAGLMAQGRLISLVPESIPSPAAFYLRIHPRASARARLFADWLQANVEGPVSG